MNIPGYDDWKLHGPDDDDFAVGENHGETCNRFAEPDEDAPRNYRPRRCSGTMHEIYYDDDYSECDTCGESPEGRA